MIAVNVGIVRLPNNRQVPTTYTNQLATTPGWGRGLFLNATTTVSLLWRQTVIAPSLLCGLQHIGLLESSQLCAAQVPDPALTNHCPVSALSTCHFMWLLIHLSIFRMNPAVHWWLLKRTVIQLLLAFPPLLLV